MTSQPLRIDHSLLPVAKIDKSPINGPCSNYQLLCFLPTSHTKKKQETILTIYPNVLSLTLHPPSPSVILTKTSLYCP
jgi:hypothetical protein